MSRIKIKEYIASLEKDENDDKFFSYIFWAVIIALGFISAIFLT